MVQLNFQLWERSNLQIINFLTQSNLIYRTCAISNALPWRELMTYNLDTGPLTLMLLVANLANTNKCKNS